VDWTGSGQITDFDRHLLEIELDAKGEPLPEGDPRRRPVFRFDAGDLSWAQAFLYFQRALVQLLLAYEWTEGAGVMRSWERKESRLVIRLREPARVKAARDLILKGLEQADHARVTYLAETDDDREWLPNPRQKSHPLPLPVDQALYETWAGVITDLRRLLKGEEGLGVAALAQLGDHQWKDPPRGYLDIGKMLDTPRDIVLELDEARRLEDSAEIERTLERVFGDTYVRSMKPSPLIDRLRRMKREMTSGEETLERKLRYLFWLN
jgi:hypothetical protein